MCGHSVSWYLTKSVWFCVSHPVSGKVVRLTDWAVWVPSPQLGCLSVSPSFLLPLSFLPLSHLPITLLQWWPARQGIFFLRLPYLASCIGRPSPWIKSTHCSITVATIPDGSAAQVCLPCAPAKKGSLWQCEVEMPGLAVCALCVLALVSSIRAFLTLWLHPATVSLHEETHRCCRWRRRERYCSAGLNRGGLGHKQDSTAWLCVWDCVWG